jgi:hypothetical protein
MKRLAVIAAASLLVVACKTKDTKTDMTDSTAAGTTPPPSAATMGDSGGAAKHDTSMSNMKMSDTGMKAGMSKDTGMAMQKDSTGMHKKKKKKSTM